MHVCFAAIDYHEDQGGGGIASYVDAVGRELVNRGHEVTVLAKGSVPEVREERGLRLVRTPLGNLHWYFYKTHAPSIAVLPMRELEWSSGIYRCLKRLTAERPADVVEGCETGILRISGRHSDLPPLVVRLHGTPYHFHKHGGRRVSAGERLNCFLERIALRNAAYVTSPSRYRAADTARDLGWPVERIHVIPNPISASVLEEAVNNESGFGGRSATTVLYAGRIEDIKGPIPLLRSIPYVARDYPDVRYIIAGGRHTSIDDSTLRRVLDEDKTGGYVHFRGHVPWQQLGELYRLATVFVMPSYYETFGISCLEAMAFGLPVVATTAGGLPEVVEDGVTGILVPPGDSRALGEAIADLLGDSSLRRRMGQAGREKVLANFTAESVVEEIIGVYHNLRAKQKDR